MRKLFTLCLLVFSLSASAQWQLTGARVRYVNGLGIPTRDTAAGVAADSSQIVIRPADSALYVKYKRTWLRVGGTGFTGSGTANYIPKFTSSTAIGNSQIFDNGTFVGVNKTTLSGSYVLQVNGGIQSTSAGFPFQFHSTSNVNYNSFFSNNTTLFGAIGNYTGLISGGVPGDKRDSILTTLSVNDMSFATGGAFERVRITSGGQLNVGGQFTQTTNALNVVGNIGQVDALAGVQTAIKTVVTSMTLLTANSAIGTETAHDLALITANTTRANLTSSGQFNIGGNYASTNNILQVTGNTAIGYTAAAPANGLLVAGNVGIGTITPNTSFNLDVTGSIPAVFNSTNTSTSSNFGSVQLFRQTNTAGAGNGIAFGLFNNLNNIAEYGYIGSIIESNLSGGQSGSLSFFPVISGSRSEAMRITSGGKVNIGGNFASTNNTLQVAGNVAIGYTAAAPTNGLIVNGNVGIGTTNPLSKLHVNTGTNQNLRIRPGTDVGATNGIAINSRDDADATLQQLSLRASDVLMLITGNVGIGTTSPQDKLHIIGNILSDNTSFGTSQLRLKGSGTTTGFDLQNSTNDGYLWNRDNGNIYFGTNNTERMRITSAGNALIGTTTDNGTDRLQVSGSIQGTGFNQAYTARTTTYTATTSDYFIDCTSGTFTVNLFTAVGNTGRIIIVKNSGTGTITVDPNGAQTIDGAATQTLSTQWSRVHIISDGANWKIISN